MAGKILWVLQYDVRLSRSVMTAAGEGCLILGRMSSQVDNKTDLRTEFCFHVSLQSSAQGPLFQPYDLQNCICINAKINLWLAFLFLLAVRGIFQRIPDSLYHVIYSFGFIFVVGKAARSCRKIHIHHIKVSQDLLMILRAIT